MKKNISRTVEEMVREPLEAAGFEIWDIRFEKEVSDYSLVIELDRKDGMSIDDCSAANEIIIPILDSSDPVEGSYCLEVSSAGLERDLKRKSHFDLAAEKNSEVIIKLFAPLEGKKEYSGRLVSHDEDKIYLTDNGSQMEFNKKSIAKITAVFE